MRVKTIGIVGGGQLGRMLAEAALPLGFKVVCIDPNVHCPAAQAGAEQIQAAFTDAEAINNLARVSEVITIESEHINTEALEKLHKSGKMVEPEPATVRMIQDKLAQNEFLRQTDLPVADFQGIENTERGKQVLADFSGKMLLKKRYESYDGKGNAVVRSENELHQAVENFANAPLYAERFVNFSKELAVIVARDTKGRIKIFPTVETLHVNNICHEVFSPPRIKDKYIKKAEALGLETAKHLKGAGVFTIEMFLTDAGEVLINEIAPRVHNSGHLTIEASQTSQFEQHIRAITGMEMGEVEMKVPAAVMINILGERNGPAKPKGVESAEILGNVFVHIYGKADTRVGRKMGHITATADTLEAAKQKAEAARKLVSI